MNITALIVTFNRLDKLKQCWAATCGLPFEHIVIVNNASDDGTAEWLATLVDPRLVVLDTGQNLGGAGGFKMGAEHIRSAISTDWVAMYDDDAYPPADLLTRFCTIVDSQWQVYCCKVVDRAGQMCKMNQPYLQLPHTARRDVKAMFTGVRFAPDGNSAQEVSSFSFVGAIISQALLSRTCHYIYPELFIYFDDLYYSYKLKLEGNRIRYTPELVFTHDIPPATTGITPAWKVYYLVRNLLLSRRYFRHHAPYSVGALGVRMCKYLLATANQQDKKAYIGWVLRGISDGLTHKTGKRH